ncbi:MAG: fasciclin domain-containing protein [Candidatus Poseidonia sp.]|nr:fasciclin domain-containing protein [Poseidonia sp.]
MNRALTLLMIACLSLSTVAFGVAADETQDIPANAEATGDHASLVAALAHVGLVETLQGDGPFTVFAPTDAAFAEAGIDLSTFDNDEANATLVNILTYHVLAGAVDAASVTDGLVATMLNGDNATFTVSNGTVLINDATVTIADVNASNGVIHVIDKVLTPPADEPSPQGPPGVICYNVVTHTIVVGADEATCGAYTYLEDYEMNGQNVTGCYNSVTHALANVTQAICEGYMWTPAVNLAMTAAATTIHTSLVAALTTADLVATVSGNDSYTIFAPSDDAFAAAGIDLASFDTPEEIAVLADILLHHVVAGTVASSDLANGTSTVAAANGDNLTIIVGESGVTVNGANVTIADVPASNGVIHVIDQVLLPPADEPEEVDPFAGVDCAATVGVDANYAFTPTVVNIEVGETVCWSWTDASMPHNVKEVDGFKSTTYVDGGVTSGAASSTVAFSHTFTENTTFYYACEPHIGLDMFGEVVVGDGGAQPAAEPADEGEDTPGFMVISTVIAVIGALALMGRQSREDL